MDLFEHLQRAAVIVLREQLDAAQPSRETITNALHLYAIAVNEDPDIPQLPLEILSDAKLLEMVRRCCQAPRLSSRGEGKSTCAAADPQGAGPLPAGDARRAW